MKNESVLLGERVRAALDDVLEPEGFAQGQVGTDEDGVSVTFCAPYNQFRNRIPQLAATLGDNADAYCMDLVVRVDARQPPKLLEARFNALDIRTLTDGRRTTQEGSAATTAWNPDLDGALDAVRAEVTGLFAQTRRET